MDTTTSDMGLSADLLTYREAGELLGIGAGAVARAIAKGKLHPIKLPGSAVKYLRRSEVLDYPQRRWVPVRNFEKGEAQASATPAPAIPDAAQLRELATALSGPTMEALRDAQATSRAGVEGLVRIAVGLAVGAMGGLSSPKA